MKKTLLFALCSLFFVGATHANITLYYSPTCPHCHNAMNFLDSEKIEYKKINANENTDAFYAVVQKCELSGGGVPVLVVGEKCFQGYGESMNDEIRAAISGAPVADAQKKTESNPIYFYAGLVILILGAGLLLLKKKK